MYSEYHPSRLLRYLRLATLLMLRWLTVDYLFIHAFESIADPPLLWCLITMY